MRRCTGRRHSPSGRRAAVLQYSLPAGHGLRSRPHQVTVGCAASSRSALSCATRSPVMPDAGGRCGPRDRRRGRRRRPGGRRRRGRSGISPLPRDAAGIGGCRRGRKRAVTYEPPRRTRFTWRPRWVELRWRDRTWASRTLPRAVAARRDRDRTEPGRRRSCRAQGNQRGAALTVDGRGPPTSRPACRSEPHAELFTRRLLDLSVRDRRRQSTITTRSRTSA
jgi:hypothetical protein